MVEGGTGRAAGGSFSAPAATHQLAVSSTRATDDPLAGGSGRL